ncbi:GNAT family N-acetyltransferase [Gehongia tenuis]|uniref:GNAT family N-acetyltransferase n=1 Tax=Gehongia tenuis TaxID=2763655 RepID=A0A926D606_9FIRM|nr:GNAT family N-acetyltransferase [Gehongia tenuis]MBC8531881.1 GNAT family N-acetyltransferase [Gehongia tenuis]
MSFAIRELSSEQLPECARLIRESFLAIARRYGITSENCPQYAAFIRAEDLEARRSKGGLLFGLFEADHLAGCACLLPPSRESSPAMLELVAVQPEYRHRGYGRALVQHGEIAARALGAPTLDIVVINENAKLKDWYKSYGFTEIGEKVSSELPYTPCYMGLELDRGET